jgi:two-component system catabolic regulation response regulator CreB/two-component system response regulator ChvI
LSANRTNGKGRILVVDDETDITSVLKRGLEANGYSVTAYNDPRKALDDYRPSAYDLMLIDIRMPNMNGFELYRKIQHIDPIVKICFITAYEIYYDEFRKVFPKIKVSCFVKKPVTIDELGRIIAIELGLEQPGEQTSSFQQT